MVSDLIQNLLNEVGEGNLQGAMRWHRELYKIGKPAIPLLCKNMTVIHEVKMNPDQKHHYIVQLGKVVHDIDEQACKDITNHHSFGIDIDQEDQADQFANQIIKKYHPIISKLFIPYIKFSRTCLRDHSIKKK
jgi:hypothetical protein